MWCVSIGALVIVWIVATSEGKESYILRDLLAEENTNNRRVIHNIGDGVNKERRQVEKNKDGEDDEEKKTLSQQVADGKYGLIQTELFSNAPVRPGIISYEVNPEVPKDNVNNLGGLQPEEIWLAENHLLVLGGGGYSEKEIDARLTWPPIDNYVAPRRQVKIPATPKVPPPFPIQLKEGGPTEFIRGENGTGGPPPFPPFLDPRFPTFRGNYTGNATSGGEHPPPNFPLPGNYSQGNGLQTPPFPFFPPPSNESPFFPPPGLFPGLPPGVAFLPPPGNFSDLFDEDDPSIYYPPPYDFFYPRDNTTVVPPGPLVPGIVLPPPPDFFAPLLNKTKSRRPGMDKFKTSPPPKRGKYPPPRYFTATHLPSIPQTTTQGHIEHVTTSKPYHTTTLPPLTTTVVQTSVSDEQTFNEVKPDSILHNDDPMKGWVPIPAPRPYYISQTDQMYSKDLSPTTPSPLSLTPPQQGYIYNQPDPYQTPQRGWFVRNVTKPALTHLEPYYNIITQDSPQHEFGYFPKRGRQFVPSRPEPYNNLGNFQPIFVPSGRQGTTTIAPDTYYPTRSKIPKATYYFYEEPQISQAHLEDTDDPTKKGATPAPNKIHHDTKPRIESNTPSLIQNDKGNTRSSPNHSQGQPKPIYQSYYEQGGYKPSTLGDTANYYYHNENPKLYSQDGGYSYEKPHNSPLLSNIFQNNPAITNEYFSSNLRPNGKGLKNQLTSKKPPVYEYSYSAAGYNGGQYSHLKSPLLEVSERPALFYQDNGTPVKDPKYLYYEYEPPPKTTTENYYNYKEDISSVTPAPEYQTTTKPNLRHRTQSDHVPRFQNNAKYYTTSKPWTNRQATNSIQSPQTTNNPYHAFFTHHDEPLLDDITKKYFTIFGQKINQGDVGEPVTTPLPAVTDTTTRKQYIDSAQPHITEGMRQNVKFPSEKQPVYSDDFYTTPAPQYDYNSYAAVRPTGKRPAQRGKYPSAYYTTPTSLFNSYNNYGSAQGSQSLARPTDLASDILVNYRNPLPPINPDAEIIDPAKLYRPRQRGSFISYRLPGNGDGHFYFLTPQSVSSLRRQVEDYDDDEEGYIYALPVRTRGFHKRDTPQHPRHRRKQNHQSRS